MDKLDLPTTAAIPDTILQCPSTALTNSIYSACIKVFQGKKLQSNELYTINENIRWLLRTNMGSFIKEYFQILTKGLSVILEEIQKHEGQAQFLVYLFMCINVHHKTPHKIFFPLGEKQLLVLAQVWDRFFCEILPTTQAILYPLQGQELTVRQMALLSFRDLVLIKLSLGDLLRKNMPLIPASITQMLLVLQGIQDPRGPSKNYCKLESMVAMVITPYLCNCRHTSCTDRSHMTAPLSQPEIRITHYISESSLLSPVVEQEGDVYQERVGNKRRHSVTNAHSDIQLLSVNSRVYSGMGDSCETIDGTRAHL
ncbi:proline-rich protein 5-like isoform X2 [Misgurnus anguillicaudatus]|uniref:proline-rich protein 5-like isoform X2 n=1 Tax=Misgurnus anguillicaudatus TaxID=75329 RepID=UPI002435BFF7|nr:proline-rich protein 5-like isoform X2 [Misgurnus anguillicaudatus]